MPITQPYSDGYFAKDPRQRPLYTVAAASRLIGVPQPTIRSWVWGRAYFRADGKAEWPRLIQPPQDPAHRLSFWNLLELQALRALRDTPHEVKIPLVREALEVSQKEYGIERLLIHEDLRTLAGELFLEHYGNLVHLGRGKRLVLGSIWAQLADRIDFGNDRLARRLRPRLSTAPEIENIFLDPAVAFGRPTLHGIRVDVLHSRFEGGEDAQSIADDFSLRPEEVEQAIRFDQLAAA